MRLTDRLLPSKNHHYSAKFHGGDFCLNGYQRDSARLHTSKNLDKVN